MLNCEINQHEMFGCGARWMLVCRALPVSSRTSAGDGRADLPNGIGLLVYFRIRRTSVTVRGVAFDSFPISILGQIFSFF